jgi:hypothetical protein
MKSVSAMNVVSVLSRVALVAFAAFLLGVATNTGVLSLFALATGAFTLLIVAADYAPQHRDVPDAGGDVVAFAPKLAGTTGSEKLAA